MINQVNVPYLCFRVSVLFTLARVFDVSLLLLSKSIHYLKVCIVYV